MVAKFLVGQARSANPTKNWLISVEPHYRGDSEGSLDVMSRAP